MARIPIFDSAATEDSDGNALENALSINSPLRTQPIRLTGGPKGDQRNISYEFVLSGSPVAAFDFTWYQEFWGDNPWINVLAPVGLPEGFRQVPVGPFPTQRVFPRSGANYPWAREQVAIAGALGVIDHYNITRQVTMTVPADEGADCRWFPMLVHAMWVRIAVTVTSAGPYPQLRIFAHCGGLDHVASYTERIANPWAWSVPESVTP